ncbi:hypothetical protein BOW37_12755 [Solemya velum gill symbiont]|nr:hypothetical protein BOW37_12755 [Solemya velum gill symbiont]
MVYLHVKYQKLIRKDKKVTARTQFVENRQMDGCTDRQTDRLITIGQSITHMQNIKTLKIETQLGHKFFH